MVLLQLNDPLELFVKRKEFLPGTRFLSRRISSGLGISGFIYSSRSESAEGRLSVASIYGIYIV